MWNNLIGLTSTPSNTFRMNWNANCEPGLTAQHQCWTSVTLLYPNGNKSLQPGSNIWWKTWKQNSGGCYSCRLMSMTLEWDTVSWYVIYLICCLSYPFLLRSLARSHPQLCSKILPPFSPLSFTSFIWSVFLSSLHPSRLSDLPGSGHKSQSKQFDIKRPDWWGRMSPKLCGNYLTDVWPAKCVANQQTWSVLWIAFDDWFRHWSLLISACKIRRSTIEK